MMGSVTMWIIIITIFLQGSSTIDMLKWLNIPVNCVVETSTLNTKQRSVMASDGSNAAWFAGYVDYHNYHNYYNNLFQIRMIILNHSIFIFIYSYSYSYLFIV